MIFRKKKPAGTGEIETYIGESTVIEGDLRLEGTVRVDGCVRGCISGGEVVVIIGRSGVVEGDISARFVFAGGRVKGDITATQSLEIFSSAEIEGTLEYFRISIEEGALVQGSFRRLSGPAQAEAVPAAEAGGAVKPAGADHVKT